MLSLRFSIREGEEDVLAVCDDGVGAEASKSFCEFDGEVDGWWEPFCEDNEGVE